MGDPPGQARQLSTREGVFVVVAYAVLCIVCVAVEPFRSVPFLWAVLPNTAFFAYFFVRVRFNGQAAT